MASAAPARALRRSCQFCRARKVRCSGQEKCDACRERNLDCIYGLEAPKGRPRKRTRPESSAQDSGDSYPTLILPMVPDSTADAMRAPGGAGALGSSVEASSSVVLRSLGSELEVMFERAFGDAALTSPPADSYYLKALWSFNRKAREHPLPPIQHHASCSAMGYGAVRGALTQELVEMTCTRYGRLGCSHLADTRGTFFFSSLASDTSPAMFHGVVAPPPGENPIDKLSPNRVLQLIETWFSLHPISTLVSRTLLLRQYKNKVHDQMLLSLIIAQALYMSREAPFCEFLDYAISQFHNLPANICNISTAQTLALLTWHDLSLSRNRRGTCFLGCACQMLMKLMKLPTGPASRINGIDTGAVERELIKNIYWILLILTLWGFMQFDYPFSPEMLPSPEEMGFPPTDEKESEVYKLDLASGNTFQSQIKMVGDLWAMSNIASTVGHIYALFPSAESPILSSWDASPARQLHLPPPASDHDIADLCTRVKEILTMASKQLVDADVYVRSESRAVVLLTYHTLVIHLLFPLPGNQPLPDVLDSLVASGKAFIAVAHSEVANIGGKGIWYGTVTNDPFTANILTLGIDAFSRALGALCQLGILLPRRAEFTEIAENLLLVTKLERMGIARRGREIRKELKAAIARIKEDMPGTTDEAEWDPPPFPADAGCLGKAPVQYVGVEETFEAFDPFPGLLASENMFGQEQEQEHTYQCFFPSPVSGHQQLDMPLEGFSVARETDAQFEPEEPVNLGWGF